MKKSIALILTIIASASLWGFKAQATNIPIPIKRTQGGTGSSGGILRSPAFVPIDAYVSNAMVYVDFLNDLGEVEIELTNITTGDSVNETIENAIGWIVISFSGDSGSYQITFTLSSGAKYSGEFELP